MFGVVKKYVTLQAFDECVRTKCVTHAACVGISQRENAPAMINCGQRAGRARVGVLIIILTCPQAGLCDSAQVSTLEAGVAQAAAGWNSHARQ